MPVESLFDNTFLARSRQRALRIGDKGAWFLLDATISDLSERLGTVERDFANAAVLDPPTGGIAAALAQSGKVGSVSCVFADPAAAGRIPLEPASIDLAVSLLTLQVDNDLPGTLVQLRRALRPDGLFVAALLGAGTLAELRESLLGAEAELHGGASARVIPFADVRDAGALLQRAGLALPVTDVEPYTVRYPSLTRLMHDLRAMGAANPLAARSRRPASRRLFARAEEIYRARHGDPDGRLRATFNVIWMSGWAPHESQQTPLNPGSATRSLKDVL